MPTPRRILTVLIPASSLIFFTSLLISSISFYSTRQFKLNDAVISNLQSPDDNPRGYLIACAGTAVSAILFLSIAAFFFRSLVRRNRTVAATGSVIYALGLLAAILIGCLAPFPTLYDPVHIPLAYIAFIAIFSGLLVCLACANYPPSRWNFLLDLTLLAIVLYLLYLVVGPDSNDVAFIEWTLSVGVAAYTAILTAVLNRPTR
jgi:hypothetical protein